MNPVLKKIKNIYAEGCVTVIMNTHRTRPDNSKDPLLLKNLLKEAQERLDREFDKRFAGTVMGNLNAAADKIDHNYNLESLILFANTEFSDFTRLPVGVTDRVVIDSTFATRDLVRAMRQESSYYVLVLSRQQARLIEAHNDRVIEEKSGAFPFENGLYTTDKEKLTSNKGQDNLIEEYFNRVDKLVNETVRDNPLPVVISTETRNYDHYIKVADNRDIILGHIAGNRDLDKAIHIVPDAWEFVQEEVRKKNDIRIAELKKAVSANRFESDSNEIWKAIKEGRGNTLFVKKGFYLPVELEDGRKSDDIIDEMIEQNLAFGGDVVFLEGDELEKFQNLALTTRY